MTHRKNESKGYACGETPVNWKSSGKRELERRGGLRSWQTHPGSRFGDKHWSYGLDATFEGEIQE